MPVLALSEHGLIIDVFGEKPKVIKSIDYVLNNNIVVSYISEKLKFIDLKDDDITEVVTEKVKEMKISKNGSILGSKTIKNNLNIYKSTVLIRSFENVEDFDVSNRFVYFYTQNEFIIFDLENDNFNLKTDVMPKQAVALENDIILLTTNFELKLIRAFIDTSIERSEKIISTDYFDVLPNSTGDILFKYKTANKISVHECKEGFIVLAETSYSSITYFAQLSLHYFIRNADGSFTILHYNTLGDILHVGFIQNEFFVVNGSQPANCFVYEKATGKKKFYR